MHAGAKATELWHRHGLSIPVDLHRIVSELGLEVITFPFRGRVKEVIVDGIIGVRAGLPRPWFRWYVAHAIGHHLLHVGTSFSLDEWQWVNHAKAERQADEFAAWLLSGPDGWLSTAAEMGIPRGKLASLRTLTTAPAPDAIDDSARAPLTMRRASAAIGSRGRRSRLPARQM